MRKFNIRLTAGILWLIGAATHLNSGSVYFAAFYAFMGLLFLLSLIKLRRNK